MYQDTGVYIAVPEDVAAIILREGYVCTRRGRVPAHRNREGAVRAYRRCQRSRPPVLLQATVPPGIATTLHKDGIKLETKQLAPRYLAADDRARTVSPSSSPASTAPYLYQAPMRPASARPSAPGPSYAGTTHADRVHRLQKCQPTTLYHCTALTNAHSIINFRQFHAGFHGFIGPGIYFSRSPNSARRYCQCRTPGPRVVLACQVKLGNIKHAFKGHRGTGQELLAEGCDSYEEANRDSLMLPDNRDGQIDMSSVHIISD
eukprot:TRINITY_DN90981_c0_g1_i1.p1 TRINITY_DN90981_c0_g1~~TRINITY_DN90981_c0_g1_i1.p1  ORF type:complete len:261 (-),score=16.83 TRINITY_DN90981_c0_g1_i1:142-924(-)